MKRIPLSQGKFAIVDNEDYLTLSKVKWFYGGDGYAAREVSTGKGRQARRCEKMHRVINKTPKGMDTDHINNDKLDNRKCNLRTATKSQNDCNRRRQRNNTSGFKGVSFHKSSGKWTARIALHRKMHNLGLFPTPELAHKAYCKAAKELHKEFARIK